MVSRKNLVPFTLSVVMLATFGGGITAHAQSYTAPAGIPPETTPGGLTGVDRTPPTRTTPSPVPNRAMELLADSIPPRTASRRHPGAARH